MHAPALSLAGSIGDALAEVPVPPRLRHKVGEEVGGGADALGFGLRC